MNGNIIHDMFVVTILLSNFRLEFFIPANWEMPQSITPKHFVFAPMAEADLAYFSRSCESQAVLAVKKFHIKGIKTYPPCHHSCFYEISFFVTLCMETGLLARFKKCLLQKIHLITDQLLFYLLHLNVLKGWCINKFNLSFR